ncbi:Uncharacterized protein Fot_08910 [Forsythia ovata]|uniref:Uncharacterized protein n=1 Tax=Forsythia ovata TaxID=205694 RepID=A0ABD1WCI4_9LAMI
MVSKRKMFYRSTEKASRDGMNIEIIELLKLYNQFTIMSNPEGYDHCRTRSHMDLHPVVNRLENECGTVSATEIDPMLSQMNRQGLHWVIKIGVRMRTMCRNQMRGSGCPCFLREK